MTAVVRLSAESDQRVLGDLLGRGVEIAFACDHRLLADKDDGSDIWIRCDDARKLDVISGTRFQLEDDGRLVHWGHRVASARIPEGLVWKPLEQAISISLPPAALAGRLGPHQRSRLRLVTGGSPTSVAAMCVTLSDLAQWAESASDVRLKRLRFVIRGNRAMVLGEPLPPIEGVFWVNEGRVLIPAGKTWSPAISVSDVRAALGVPNGTWIIWQSDDDVGSVDDSDWMPLRRSSLRAAASEFA